jgi:hypothetical protein
MGSVLNKIKSYYRLVEEVLEKNPQLDRGDILHTLFCLELSPKQRLEQGLRRGHAAAFFRKRIGLS